MTQQIYLDNSASTALAPEVKRAISEALDCPPGNPSSIHQFGQQAKAQITKVRKEIASFLDVHPQEIIFTSGGTESMHLLVQGAALNLLEEKRDLNILYCPLDHPCVVQTVQSLSKCHGVNLHPQITVNIQKIEKKLSSLKKEPSLLVFSAVNSETGCMIDLEAVAKLANQYSTPLIIDGVALLGKAPITLYPGISGMGFSAHKIHGPPGVGFIYKKHAFTLSAQFLGGGQMEGMRSGTENRLGIVGLGTAIKLLKSKGSTIYQHLKMCSDNFKALLQEHKVAFEENGPSAKAPGILNLYFPEVDAETLLIYLDQRGIAISAGTACASGALEPSYVLMGMGLSKEKALHSVRFSFSRFTSLKELEITASTIKSIC